MMSSCSTSSLSLLTSVSEDIVAVYPRQACSRNHGYPLLKTHWRCHVPTRKFGRGPRAVCGAFPRLWPRSGQNSLFRMASRPRSGIGTCDSAFGGLVFVLAKWRTALSGLVRQGRRKIVKPLKRLYRETLGALRRNARSWRARQRRLTRGDVTYVGVTGSCGKTTTTRRGLGRVNVPLCSAPPGDRAAQQKNEGAIDQHCQGDGEGR